MGLKIPNCALVIIGRECHDGYLGNIDVGCEVCLGRFDNYVEEECCCEVEIDVGDKVGAEVDMLLLLSARIEFWNKVKWIDEELDGLNSCKVEEDCLENNLEYENLVSSNVTSIATKTRPNLSKLLYPL